MGNTALDNIVRVGTVSSVNAGDRTARVKFPSLGDMVSGNLRVLQQYGCAVDVPVADAHTHPDTKTTYWMPNVGDTVICLYLPVFNGDGVILGVLK